MYGFVWQAERRCWWFGLGEDKRWVPRPCMWTEEGKKGKCIHLSWFHLRFTADIAMDFCERLNYTKAEEMLSTHDRTTAPG